ncbi:MAG: hypothetical protein Q8K54_06040, partial [Gallionella sp.]|nr:hypothetical protein [Gallionella sp.]
YRVSLEGQLIDSKSLRAVTGKTADWNEIAKECMAFSNATGGRLLLGIADGRDALPASHQIGVMNWLSDNVRPIGASWAIEDDQSTACAQTKRITTGTTP